jgi:hypothetical protein
MTIQRISVHKAKPGPIRATAEVRMSPTGMKTFVPTSDPASASVNAIGAAQVEWLRTKSTSTGKSSGARYQPPIGRVSV